MGAKHPALWNTDVKRGDEKAFCCINSNARDFARLGKLYLNQGNWNGTQLLDSNYVKEATSVANLLDEGVKLGVSSRGVGSLNKTNEGYSVVGEDFTLATAADIVADPSAPDAFVDGIMEGKEWVWDGGIIRERLASKTYKRINTLVDQNKLDEQKLNAFQDFLANL